MGEGDVGHPSGYATTLVCGVCARAMAPSEMMSFNSAAAKRAGMSAMCPACADAPSRRWRIFGRAPDFYIVSVPDLRARDRCVSSYIAHDWTVAYRDDSVVRVKKHRRQIAIEIAVVTMSVGESALRSLDPRFWRSQKERNIP